MLIRRLVGLVCVVVLGGGLTGLMAVPAAAEECPYIDETTGEIVYCDEDPGEPGEPGDPGGGGGEPSCEFVGSYNEFCEGEAACWGNNPAANDEEDVADELGPKPDDPDVNVAYKECRRPDGSIYDEWYWATPGDGPTLAELAQRAYGSLRTPAYTPTFNPPNASYVNLDTWWWAEGAGGGEINGTPALGLVAIASPNRMEIDPGDGSGIMSCDFQTSKSDACSYVYHRSSRGGPYPARMRLVYDVRFERNGAVVNVGDAAPNSLSSPWAEAPIPVREIQSVVTDVG